MAKGVLKLLNSIYGLIVGLFLTTVIAVACYSIWDNFRIYQTAEITQNQIRLLKPVDTPDSSPDFAELLTVNKDVVGWVTIDDTNIDYPILQGENNLEYMNKDVYGEFSLAGSLFLDSRNNGDFSDRYSLVYGHNMDEHLMFGDLALFKDKDFFAEHTDATVMIPDDIYDMKVAAILQISAGTEEIFNPDMWKNSLDGMAEFLKENSIWYHADIIDSMIVNVNNFQIIALATCSEGNTNDRTVLILVRERPESNPSDSDEDSKNPDDNHDVSDSNDTSEETDESDDITGSGPKPTGDSQNSILWICLIAGAVIFIAVFEILEKNAKHKK